MATCPAHAAGVLFRLLDSLPGLRLDIDIGMGGRDDAIALALAAGINPHGDGLDVQR